MFLSNCHSGSHHNVVLNIHQLFSFGFQVLNKQTLNLSFMNIRKGNQFLSDISIKSQTDHQYCILYVYNILNVVTIRVPDVKQDLTTPTEHLRSFPVFARVRVA